MPVSLQTANPLPVWRIRSTIFLLSAVILFSEILLMRVFAIQYWHHFASFIISLALLGFGASGTVLYLLRRRLDALLDNLLFFVPLALALGLWVVFLTLRHFTFNPFLLLLEGREIIQMLALVLVLFIPFFLGALGIGVSLSIAPGGVFPLYFANLAGSAAGCLLLFLTWLRLDPGLLFLTLSGLAVCAAVFAARGARRLIWSALMLAILPLLYGIFAQDRSLEMSPLKDLAQARHAEGAVTEAERFGPLGLVTVLSGPAFHYQPDLSLNCPYPLPEQKGLFIDGNIVGSINRFNGNPTELRYMAYRTASLAYQFLQSPHVLIIGGGAGSEILNARYHGARQISVVELNPDVIALMQGQFRDFSGAVYSSGPIRVHAEEGRGFLDGATETYDMIQMVLLGSMGTAAAGVYSLNEDYLFTVESVAQALRRLAPGGILSVSQWMENPPRSSMKLLTMAVETLRRQDLDPSQCLMMIRSWQTVTLILKKGAFAPGDREKVRHFCRSRLFDPCWFPGMRSEEANRVNRLAKDPFYEAALRLFAGEADSFYHDYAFHIAPATDGRPFFSHSFRYSHLQQVMGPSGRDFLPYMDWGYLLAWLSFLLLAAVSLALILLPLCRRETGPVGDRLAVFLYFGALGLGYMLLEIAFLQRFIRYLHHPALSSGVVIGSFLVFSGIGSCLGAPAGKSRRKCVPFAIPFLVLAGIAVDLAARALEPTLSQLTLPLRILICILLIAPLAIPMGIPFPAGLEKLSGKSKGLIPWAWGVNGFFSVIGASGAVLIAVSWGFAAVIWTALVLYILAAICFAQLFSSRP